MRITALTENTTEYDLPVEHGLSLYIEALGHKILFDTGQSETFARNAEELGADLTAVDIAVLSHDHYDHAGGIKKFLEINDKAPLYMSRCAFEERYHGDKYIGIDKSLQGSGRIILTCGVTEIADGLTLYDCNDREKLIDFGSFGLTMTKNGEKVPDDFRHEHYLLIEERGKRVLISGCSHKGIINIENWFEPDVLVGGFHFMDLPLDDKLESYAKALDSFDTVYYTCHCTGTEQYAFMKKYMNKLHYISTGKTITI
ncbi:MAG: MBL fold metallo-hydrolase [Ruminococcus sp.]|nr:MBL fold metallo-hydrolase [Ruminococcus sp.]